MNRGEPLNSAMLAELALAYAARYQTTRAKLRRYLAGKVRARGWADEAAPDLDAAVERAAATGAVDDRAWAEAKAGALTRRGYGAGRVRMALTAGGVDRETGAALAAANDADAAAEAYARRRRLGRHRADGPGERDQQRRDLAAMLRAGHAMEAARRALAVNPDGD